MRNDLYACVNEGSDFAKIIIKYDLQTKNTVKVFTSEFTDSSVQGIMINTKWMIWSDSSADGTRHRIYYKNLNSGKVDIITKLDYEGLTPVDPFLYEDTVAWVEPYTSGNGQTVGKVMLYNLEKGNKSSIGEIKQLSLFNNFIYINENKVLWTDSYNGKGYYKFYDLKEKKTISYESKYLYPGYARFSGDKVFSINFNDYHKWTDQTFEAYDLTKKEYSKISSSYINRFTISKDLIAIIDSNNMLELHSNKGAHDRVSIKNLAIDSIDVSDNKLIAVAASDDFTKTTLYIIDLSKIVLKP